MPRRILSNIHESRLELARSGPCWLEICCAALTYLFGVMVRWPAYWNDLLLCVAIFQLCAFVIRHRPIRLAASQCVSTLWLGAILLVQQIQPPDSLFAVFCFLFIFETIVFLLLCNREPRLWPWRKKINSQG